MPTVLRFRRGDTTASNAFTGAEGELYVDTSKDTIVVHDGVTAGGTPLATEAALTAGLDMKASLNQLSTGLSSKVEASAFTSALAGKADTSALTSGLAGKQDTLVSGTNIKTVNGTSILGSGNITISGGSGGGDLTQVASDITPTFDSVYDLGSTTNRFYDAYLGNKLDINDATLSGSSVVVPGGTSTSYVTNSQYLTTTSISNGATAGNGLIMPWNAGPENEALLLAIPVGTVISITGTTSSYFTGGGTGVVTANNGLVGPGPNGWMAVQLVWDQAVELISISSISWHQDTVTPVVTQLPDTYDYTLASNATLVAPSLAVDTSLVGGLFTEGTTVTPEHILGAYTDTKGTLTIDGSLKVNDDLAVRNSITLQQQEVVIGKVTEFTTGTGVIDVTYAADDNWYAAFKDTTNQTSPGMGATSFYMYQTYMYWSQTDLTQSPTASSWVAGKTFTMTLSNGTYWKYRIESIVVTPGMGTQVNYTELETNSSQSAYIYSMGGMSNFGQGGGYSSYPVDLALSATGVVNQVVFDNAAIPLTNANKILINGEATTPPMVVQKSVNTSWNSTGWYNVSNSMAPGIVGFEYSGSLANLSTLPEIIRTTIEIFSNGNLVSIDKASDATGVYRVSNAGLQYTMMGGPNSGWGFSLEFVSGVDVVNNNNFYIAITGGAFNYAHYYANINTATDYTAAYLSQLVSSTVGVNSYGSGSNWDWLSVGDVLSYMPSTTAITFKKDDGTSLKAITYNNSTGAITYDGVKSLIGDTVSVNALYSDTNVDASTKTANQSTSYGYSTFGGQGSVNIGYSAGNGSSSSTPSNYGTSVGGFAKTLYNGVAIGYTANSEAYGVAIGSNAIANSSNSTVIGNQSYIGSGAPNVTAWGGTMTANTKHQLYTWTHHGVVNQTGVWYLSTNPNYYGAQSSANSNYGTYLPSILGQNDSLARLRITAFCRKPSYVGGGDNWDIHTQEYVIANTSSGVYSLTPVGSLTTVAQCGNSSWNGNHNPSLEISGGYLYAKVQKMNTEYAQVAIKIEMQSATWALN